MDFNGQNFRKHENRYVITKVFQDYFLSETLPFIPHSGRNFDIRTRGARGPQSKRGPKHLEGLFWTTKTILGAFSRQNFFLKNAIKSEFWGVLGVKFQKNRNFLNFLKTACVEKYRCNFFENFERI